MTNDERIEALTQSLELLTLDARSLEQAVSELKQTVHDGFMALKDSTENLLKIAQLHEQRLQRLEGR